MPQSPPRGRGAQSVDEFGQEIPADSIAKPHDKDQETSAKTQGQIAEGAAGEQTKPTSPSSGEQSASTTAQQLTGSSSSSSSSSPRTGDGTAKIPIGVDGESDSQGAAAGATTSSSSSSGTAVENTTVPSKDVEQDPIEVALTPALQLQIADNLAFEREQKEQQQELIPLPTKPEESVTDYVKIFEEDTVTTSGTTTAANDAVPSTSGQNLHNHQPPAFDPPEMPPNLSTANTLNPEQLQQFSHQQQRQYPSAPPVPPPIPSFLTSLGGLGGALSKNLGGGTLPGGLNNTTTGTSDNSWAFLMPTAMKDDGSHGDGSQQNGIDTLPINPFIQPPPGIIANEIADDEDLPEFDLNGGNAALGTASSSSTTTTGFVPSHQGLLSGGEEDVDQDESQGPSGPPAAPNLGSSSSAFLPPLSSSVRTKRQLKIQSSVHDGIVDEEDQNVVMHQNNFQSINHEHDSDEDKDEDHRKAFLLQKMQFQKMMQEKQEQQELQDDQELRTKLLQELVDRDEVEEHERFDDFDHDDDDLRRRLHEQAEDHDYPSHPMRTRSMREEHDDEILGGHELHHQVEDNDEVEQADPVDVIPGNNTSSRIQMPRSRNLMSSSLIPATSAEAAQDIKRMIQNRIRGVQNSMTNSVVAAATCSTSSAAVNRHSSREHHEQQQQKLLTKKTEEQEQFEHEEKMKQLKDEQMFEKYGKYYDRGHMYFYMWRSLLEALRSQEVKPDSTRTNQERAQDIVRALSNHASNSLNQQRINSAANSMNSRFPTPSMPSMSDHFGFGSNTSSFFSSMFGGSRSFGGNNEPPQLPSMMNSATSPVDQDPSKQFRTGDSPMMYLVRHLTFPEDTALDNEDITLHLVSSAKKNKLTGAPPALGGDDAVDGASDSTKSDEEGDTEGTKAAADGQDGATTTADDAENKALLANKPASPILSEQQHIIARSPEQESVICRCQLAAQEVMNHLPAEKREQLVSLLMYALYTARHASSAHVTGVISYCVTNGGIKRYREIFLERNAQFLRWLGMLIPERGVADLLIILYLGPNTTFSPGPVKNVTGDLDLAFLQNSCRFWLQEYLHDFVVECEKNNRTSSGIFLNGNSCSESVMDDVNLQHGIVQSCNNIASSTVTLVEGREQENPATLSSPIDNKRYLEDDVIPHFMTFLLRVLEHLEKMPKSRESCVLTFIQTLVAQADLFTFLSCCVSNENKDYCWDALRCIEILLQMDSSFAKKYCFEELLHKWIYKQPDRSFEKFNAFYPASPIIPDVSGLLGGSPTLTSVNSTAVQVGAIQLPPIGVSSVSSSAEVVQPVTIEPSDPTCEFRLSGMKPTASQDSIPGNNDEKNCVLNLNSNSNSNSTSSSKSSSKSSTSSSQKTGYSSSNKSDNEKPTVRLGSYVTSMLRLIASTAKIILEEEQEEQRLHSAFNSPGTPPPPGISLMEHERMRRERESSLLQEGVHHSADSLLGGGTTTNTNSTAEIDPVTGAPATSKPLRREPNILERIPIEIWQRWRLWYHQTTKRNQTAHNYLTQLFKLLTTYGSYELQRQILPEVFEKAIEDYVEFNEVIYNDQEFSNVCEELIQLLKQHKCLERCAGQQRMQLADLLEEEDSDKFEDCGSPNVTEVGEDLVIDDMDQDLNIEDFLEPKEETEEADHGEIKETGSTGDENASSKDHAFGLLERDDEDHDDDFGSPCDENNAVMEEERNLNVKQPTSASDDEDLENNNTLTSFAENTVDSAVGSELDELKQWVDQDGDKNPRPEDWAGDDVDKIPDEHPSPEDGDVDKKQKSSEEEDDDDNNPDPWSPRKNSRSKNAKSTPPSGGDVEEPELQEEGAAPAAAAPVVNNNAAASDEVEVLDGAAPPLDGKEIVEDLIPLLEQVDNTLITVPQQRTHPLFKPLTGDDPLKLQQLLEQQDNEKIIKFGEDLEDETTKGEFLKKLQKQTRQLLRTNEEIMMSRGDHKVCDAEEHDSDNKSISPNSDEEMMAEFMEKNHPESCINGDNSGAAGAPDINFNPDDFDFGDDNFDSSPNPMFNSTQGLNFNNTMSLKGLAGTNPNDAEDFDDVDQKVAVRCGANNIRMFYNEEGEEEESDNKTDREVAALSDEEDEVKTDPGDPDEFIIDHGEIENEQAAASEEPEQEKPSELNEEQEEDFYFKASHALHHENYNSATGGDCSTSVIKQEDTTASGSRKAGSPGPPIPPLTAENMRKDLVVQEEQGKTTATENDKNPGSGSLGGASAAGAAASSDPAHEQVEPAFEGSRSKQEKDTEDINNSSPFEEETAEDEDYEMHNDVNAEIIADAQQEDQDPASNNYSTPESEDSPSIRTSETILDLKFKPKPKKRSRLHSKIVTHKWLKQEGTGAYVDLLDHLAQTICNSSNQNHVPANGCGTNYGGGVRTRNNSNLLPPPPPPLPVGSPGGGTAGVGAAASSSSPKDEEMAEAGDGGTRKSDADSADIKQTPTNISNSIPKPLYDRLEKLVEKRSCIQEFWGWQARFKKMQLQNPSATVLDLFSDSTVSTAMKIYQKELEARRSSKQGSSKGVSSNSGGNK
ncbi:unnamed protein product [Amoebophrya sp. A120]|nr:unnamed protein product [Amoebophrya sp. A120]|eukprot:GSA120T00022358001.1